MVPIRVLMLIAIPLIGIFLQKSSSKRVGESKYNVERSSNLGERELIRTKRDLDSTFSDMTESEGTVGDKTLSSNDEIEKRAGRRKRRGSRKRSRRRGGSRRRGSRRRRSRRKPSRKNMRQGRKGSENAGPLGIDPGTILESLDSGLGAIGQGIGLVQTAKDGEDEYDAVEENEDVDNS